MILLAMTLQDYLSILQKVGSRYAIVAGIAFLAFYVILYTALSSRKIQKRFPKSSDYMREIGYSLLTIAIFGIVPLLLIKNPTVRPYTTLYTDIADYGLAWFIGAFPVMTLMHDTYFYWTHRFMHHPTVFRWFHLLHHRSTNPSPWAAYAFHPLEAIVEVGIFAVFLFTIPIHPLHFALFFLFSIIYNVYGHLGWELYPKGFSRHPIGRWVNTSVNHNLHHQHFKGNYGLYFLFWDRWMGTIRPDYEQHFDEVKDRK